MWTTQEATEDPQGAVMVYEGGSALRMSGMSWERCSFVTSEKAGMGQRSLYPWLKAEWLYQ